MLEKNAHIFTIHETADDTRAWPMLNCRSYRKTLPFADFVVMPQPATTNLKMTIIS